MIQIVEADGQVGLKDYATVAHLAPAVQELRSEAELLTPSLEGRTVWMVNSTALGGGVAEMLPKMVSMMNELGVETRWVTIGTDRQEFFNLTKRIHNMIHGVGAPGLSAEDRTLYEAVSRENADDFRSRIGRDDVLITHDPQPLGMGTFLKQELGLPAVWRCHIGLDEHLPVTRAVWEFLRPYATVYDHAVFSAPEYIPDYLTGSASVIHPSIDPLSHKNRTLSPHKLMGILCNAALAEEHAPVLTPAFDQPAKRLLPDGRWAPASELEEIGLVYRPTVVQISRWDRLKGYPQLLEAFIRLKTQPLNSDILARHRRRLKIMRLVLAGPDPAGVSDDPEAVEVLDELSRMYLTLEPELQRDVVLVLLPMTSRKQNALMVNALQRCATVSVQNSIREGFGLTVVEAMWKQNPVVGSGACGIRQQIRDGLDGRLIDDPENPRAVAEVLDEVLRDRRGRELLAMRAQRRVHQEFLIFTQIRRWLRTLVHTLSPAGQTAGA